MQMEDTGGKAVILGISETGEKIPAAAGRISTQPGTATKIFENSQDAEKNRKLIVKVTQSGHNSTIEHTVYHLAFENVSVFAEQFLIEFRLASFTVKSRRYVDFRGSGYYIPGELPPKAREQYTAAMESFFQTYTTLTELGMAKEDARFVLPYCLYSNFFCTANAREFLHMLRAMLYGRGAAFPELKELGLQLLRQARELTPGILSEFESRCERRENPAFPVFPKSESGAPDNAIALLDGTPNAAELVVRTALLAEGYSDADASAISRNSGHRETVLRYLFTSPRPRALEAANFTYRVGGISLSCLTHYARHRMQSIQIPCLTHADRAHHVMPVFPCDEAKTLYERTFREANELYQTLRAAGVSEKTLVYTLLSGNTIDIVTTMNGRELALFFRLRCCNRAQWEIREHADEMLRLGRQSQPELFRYFGPSCYMGSCPEGRMSCGRQAEMREKYSNLI